MPDTEYSTNERAEQLLGRRDEKGPIGIVLFYPTEQGYRCPVHGEDVSEETLHWSEYKGFLWCELCNKDYPSALCCTGPDALDRAIKVFLDCIEDGVRRALQS